MSDKLILAVPSKGRLQEQANAYFADAGLPMSKAAGARGYRAVRLLRPRRACLMRCSFSTRANRT